MEPKWNIKITKREPKCNLNEQKIFVSKDEYVSKNKIIGKIQNVQNESHGILNFMIWGVKF